MLEFLSILLPLAWLVFPATAWFANLFLRKRLHPVVLLIMTGIVTYLLLLVAVWVVDAHLYAEMNKFDLDGDGGIGGVELTPEAERAAQEWASDTGRTFAPFIGLPLSAIWISACFSVLYAGEWLIRKTIFKKPLTRPSQDTPFTPDETGNPFQPPRSN